MKTLLQIFLFLFISLNSSASEVKTIEVHAKKMNSQVKNYIILPEGYQTNDKSYPVLYLLHGFGDTYKKWVDATTIEQLADQHQLIIVCPDAGRSWYFDSPIDPKSQYESYITQDLIPYLDKNFRTKADRGNRALCGLSMGGHGSMYLALRHKNLFSIAVPQSGGLDIRPFPNNWKLKKYLGDIKNHPENWEKNTVLELAKNLKDGELAISVDCDSEDFFVGLNRDFKKLLNDKKVKFSYQEHPGAHNWSYWQKAIVRQLPFIMKNFEKK